MNGMEPTPAQQAHVAVEDVLSVVAKAAQDLNAFHAAVSRARVAPLPPFPKATVIVAVEVIDHLQAVEQGLRDILTGLGLAEPDTGN